MSTRNDNKIREPIFRGDARQINFVNLARFRAAMMWLVVGSMPMRSFDTKNP